MKNYKKIGLFGGTFNPPHKGHINAAKRFYSDAGLDLLYIMPSYIPPHKELSFADSPVHRYNMSVLSFSGKEFDGCNIVFSDLELLRKGQSFTIDTVNALSELHKGSQIYLYVGSDMYFSLESWKNFTELFEKCIIVTAPRDNNSVGRLFEYSETYREKYHAKSIILDFTPIELSSTYLRELFVQGVSSKGEKEKNEAKSSLTVECFGYIMENKLYDPEAEKCHSDEMPTDEETLIKIRNELKSYISGERLSHTLSVEKEAEELARIYLPLYGYGSAYLNDIKAAALLHDITKDFSLERQLELYEKHTCEDYVSESILHSRTSAYIAREKYIVNNRVYGAIFNHTTGCADMNIFEKIICIADYIEPKRKHRQCIELRAEFRGKISKANEKETLIKALDEALLSSFEMTIAYLKDRQLKIHPDILRARDFISRGNQ